MAFTLRPYQQAAVNAAIAHMSKTTSSCVIEAATGAGKSLIVAEIAKWLTGISGKKVLCLQPSKELTEQNAEKYAAYGFQASIYSAASGSKCMRHNVVFGTPKSVHNSMQKFGPQFAAVIVDECHTTSPTIKAIINSMREQNPNLRVCGLSATPYRMGTGYVYAIGMDGAALDEGQTVNPFYDKLIFRITAAELIEQGYLTPPVADAEISEHYDTSGLLIKANGQFDSSTIEQAFEGHGRKTSAIVSEVVALSEHKQGVMFFAATIQHAEEVLASLPHGMAAIVTGKTPKGERAQIIERFKRREIKYLVNVAVLTTGFDAPHVDVVAILRATESASLLQQIIGRGLRLSEGKATCLILDYAENVDRHGLEDDFFTPVIKTSLGNKEAGTVPALCRSCGFVNQFAARKNPEGFEIDDEGYFVDLAGNRIDAGGEQHIPAHMGRRCNNTTIGHDFKLVRCEQRWSAKICPECEAENDIAARYCCECKAELVDPNERLRLEYKKMKRDPYATSTDRVIGWRYQPWMSQKGNKTLRVDYTTEFRTFPVWYSPDSNNGLARALWTQFCHATLSSGTANTIEEFCAMEPTMPRTITAKKHGDFFRVIAHNRPEDVCP